MKTYEETMNEAKEMLSLGYTAAEVVESIDSDIEAHSGAKSEIKSALVYGL